MEDKKLMLLLNQRSDHALAALAKRFGPRLYRTAYQILGSREDAEEAVSDTYLALWNAIPPEQPDPLEGYVHRTGRNIALKKLRYLSAQKRSSGTVPLEELTEALSGGSLEEVMDARLLGQAIDRFLDTLPSKARILFLRRYWFGDSVKALAREFAMTENALSVRLSRTRSQLKDYLNQEGFTL